MMMFGWTQPGMISIYSHLSQRNVNEKDLVLHGSKSKEEVLKPITQIQKCESCGEENAPTAIYCSKCGEILASAPEERTQEQLRSRLGGLRGSKSYWRRRTRKLSCCTA